MRLGLALGSALTVFTLALSAQTSPPPYKDASLPVEKRVADLLGRMTLEEKVAQTLAVWQQKRQLVDATGTFDPTKASAVLQYGIGQVTRPSDGVDRGGKRRSPRETVELVNAIQRWVVEHIPNVTPPLMERLAKLSVIVSTNMAGYAGNYDAAVRTHWHTGSLKLNGGLGDDELWGPSPRHGLRDCLRTWLAADPARATHLHPDGPLAVSHYTGKRKTHVGTPRRFDSIWVTPDFTVRDVQYLSHEIGRLSDHAPVVADLDVG